MACCQDQDRHRFCSGTPRGRPRQPTTYATLSACEVPTSRGAATNGLDRFSPSIQAGSRGEARYPGRETGPVPLFSGHAQGVSPFSFAARLMCEAQTSRAVANRRMDLSLPSLSYGALRSPAPVGRSETYFASYLRSAPSAGEGRHIASSV